MPTISEFFGILIRMYYDDHSPPHFHAYYSGHEAIFPLKPLRSWMAPYPSEPRHWSLSGLPSTGGIC